MNDQLIAVVVSVAGSAVMTAVGMRVHLVWIKETLERHEKAITRAHARIDEGKK